MAKRYRLSAVLVAFIASLGLVWYAFTDGPLPAAAGDLAGRLEISGDRLIFLPIVRKDALGGDPVVLAAGDTRSGCDVGDFAVLSVLDRYPSTIPILHNGDYTNTGAESEFANCYSLTWGKHRSQTRPVPGNHEYLTPGAVGYYNYFGSLARPQGVSYYSFDVGTWHIVALNSNFNDPSTSGEVEWLKSDLIAHPALCALAYWHEPRFSSGLHGDSTLVSALWQVLYDSHAEIVLNGHDHDYERFAPQGPSGELDEANGIQEFVVGTGGVAENPFGTIRANSLVRNDNTWGILEVTLHPMSYDFQFVPTPGGSFSDAGSATCH